MIILPMTERKPMIFHSHQISLDRNVLVLPLLLRVPLAHNTLNMLDDRFERGPRPKIARNTLLLQQRLILVRNNSSTHQQNIVSTLLPDELGDFWEGGHVGTVEKAHSHNINILIDSHLRNLLGCRQKTRVDYLHACVPERARQDQSASIVAVQSRLRHKDSNPLRRFDG